MSVKTISNICWAWIIVLGLMTGCQDPLTVGSDLLDNERLNLEVINDLKLNSKTIPGSRILTHRPEVDSRTYLLGQLNDNLFGKVNAELYMKFQMVSASKANYHLETSLKFDSLVLVLQYDSIATYANSIAAQQIDIYQLTAPYLSSGTYYSDTKLEIGRSPISSTTTIIRPQDSISYVDHVTRTLVKKAPQLRVRLNDVFGKGLIENADAAKSDTSFANIFRGIYIQSKSIGNNPYIYGFNFSNSALQSTEPINKLIMYYNVASGDTTLRKTFEYTIDNATINRFENDITGSVAEDFIKNPSKGDSLTFIQPMGGVKSVIGFVDFPRLDNLLINKAELEIFVADLPGQNGTYPPPGQLVLSFKNKNGDLELISDISQLVNARVDFSSVFNGRLNETGAVRKYTMNITNHIKKASKDKSINPEIYIGILTESEVPRRAVIYGAKHSTYPIKLKITHTKT